MNRTDQYQAWLNARRGESPPVEMMDRIMSAVRDSSTRADSVQKSAWQRVVPYLICSAATVVLAVRLYSVVSLLVVASPDADVAMIEPVEEISDEP